MNVISALGDWSTGGGPLHRKLLAALSAAVESGRLAPGTRLPSERVLARGLVVSRSTVVAAYDGLRAGGLAESRQGSGTYVVRGAAHRDHRDAESSSPGTPIFRRLLAGNDDRIISFACATIPGTPAIAETMSGFRPAELATLLDDTGYLAHGLPALRSAIAATLCAEGLPTEADQVLVTTGAQQALNLCASLFVHPGDVVVVEAPTYPGGVDAFSGAGARFISLPVDSEGAVLDDMERLLARAQVAAVYVMPTYQNPTGTMLAAHRRRRLAEMAGRSGVAVIEDNALAHATLGGPPAPPPIAAYQGSERAPVVTVGSVSKTLWGGLRIGWLRAPEPWLSRLARRKVATDLGSGVLDQVVAARLLERLPELEVTNSTLLQDRLEGTQELLRRHLPEWSWRQPTGGPSLWVRLAGADAARFAQVALRHGVEIIPGEAFGTDGMVFGEHVRLPFTCEPTVMAEAVGRLAAAWAAYRPGGSGRSHHEPIGEHGVVV
jgi:DNA-binding transcriptional MocR family regulator